MFNPRKELPKVSISKILRWAIRLMAFEFDIVYVKRNSIQHVGALSRLQIYKESKDKTEEKIDDKFLFWVDRMTAETRLDPVLSKITSKIRNNICENGPGKTLQRNKTEINDRTWSDLLWGSDNSPRNTKKIGDTK